MWRRPKPATVEACLHMAPTVCGWGAHDAAELVDACWDVSCHSTAAALLSSSADEADRLPCCAISLDSDRHMVSTGPYNSHIHIHIHIKITDLQEEEEINALGVVLAADSLMQSMSLLAARAAAPHSRALDSARIPSC